MDHRHGLPVRYIFSLSLSLSLSLFYSILFSTNLALSVFLFLPFFVPLSAYLPTRLPCLSVSLSVCLFRLNANVISHSLLYFNVLVPFSSPISFYVYLFLLFFNVIIDVSFLSVLFFFLRPWKIVIDVLFITYTRKESLRRQRILSFSIVTFTTLFEYCLSTGKVLL